MKKILFCIVFLLSSCVGYEKSADFLDETIFSFIGGTVFSEVEEISLKEIHLKSSNLIGKEVIVEAELLEVGQHFTFMIVADNTARMLVVLTKMNTKSLDKSISEPNRMVRILGVIESSKMGLPHVLAKSINFMPVEKT